MDIDGIYRFLGKAARNVFYMVVQRPLKNFNVDNRALKRIEKKQAAPWHDKTKTIVEQMNQNKGKLG